MVLEQRKYRHIKLDNLEEEPLLNYLLNVECVKTLKIKKIGKENIKINQYPIDVFILLNCVKPFKSLINEKTKQFFNN